MRQLPLSESDALELLSQSASHSGICCDFDGTLAPIVVDPSFARPLPGAVSSLHTIARELRVAAVISGRPASFLAKQLELSRWRSPLRAIGLHGLEECLPDGTVMTAAGAQKWRPVIEIASKQIQARLPEGAKLEDKGYGITVHWRLAKEKHPADLGEIVARSRELALDVAARHGLIAHPGKESVELTLPLGIDKGTVISELCTGLGSAGYLGDDSGDLAAFKALDELASSCGLRAVKIAVSSAEAPAELIEQADLVMDEPRAAVGFLAALTDRLRAP